MESSNVKGFFDIKPEEGIYISNRIVVRNTCSPIFISLHRSTERQRPAILGWWRKDIGPGNCMGTRRLEVMLQRKLFFLLLENLHS
jgi:hypothetical protein